MPLSDHLLSLCHALLPSDGWRRAVAGVCLLSFLPLLSLAQQFSCRWICYPLPHDGQGVWFRKTVTATGKPRRARLFVATGGMVDVLVNSRNVCFDCPAENHGGLIGAEYDISGYMRGDSNTIAIEYFPVGSRSVSCELAVTVYGERADGSPFAFSTDPSWLCHLSARSLNGDGGETLDGTAYPYVWHSAAREDFPLAQWIPACGLPGRQRGAAPPSPTASPMATVTLLGAADHARPQLIRQQKSFDIVGDSVFYEFGTGFRGFVRLTLRGARRGETIVFDGNRYVCSGTMDEQAFTKFIPHDYRRVLVCGDASFDRSQLQKVEAIETVGNRFMPRRLSWPSLF